MELFALARAPRERLPDLPARRLFISAPLASNTPAGLNDREVPVIDESVYNRNRCFRLLFNAKFGKRAALMLSRLGGGSGARGGLCGNSGIDGVGASGCLELSEGLLQHLLVAWDSVRALNEPVRPQRAPRLPRTQVTPIVNLRGFLSISHAHNHFGFCKKF